MSERGPKFDAAVVIYEAAQERLRELIDTPDKTTVDAYRLKLKAARRAVARAHKQMTEAWKHG